MIVYGDPQFEVPAHAFLRELRSHAETLPADTDELRSFLIRAGQLEQAVCDGLANNDPAPQRVGRIVDLAAEAFLAAIGFGISNNHHWQIIRDGIQQLAVPHDFRLNIKVPEGFEFYALFPEQYCASAKKWADTHSDARPRRVSVVGIRSIGTTLSAVVAARLRLLGWDASRFTVRPGGHPFSRKTELPQNFGQTPFALVVDEGPGLSGSSMGAVAGALAAAGVPDISFLPGHNGEPGAAASAETQRVWTNTPRYFTPLAELHWNGKSLWATLREQTVRLCKTADSFDRIDDLTGGGWRRFAFAHENEWPAVAAQFERMKIRCAARNGGAVLWKFVGFDCATPGKVSSTALALERIQEFARQGFCPPALGTFRGFIAVPWIEGPRLTPLDANDPSVLRHVGRYILHAAGPELSAAESAAAIDRLGEMLFWNTREILGADAAQCTRPLADAARENDIPLTYGDGHLAPYEWIRTASGILKTDCFGHDCDHTLIGKQSLLWDIAGAVVEWNLDEHTARPLLQPLEQSGIPIHSAAFNFYRMAYAAFRMGLMSLAVSQTGETAEQIRLVAAREFYRNCLERQVRNHGEELLAPIITGVPQ